MKTPAGLWIRPVLLVVFGAIGFAALHVDAQDSTYEPTPGLEQVKEAVARLHREGDKLQKETRDLLAAEGQAILDLEQTYYEGNAPIQKDIKNIEAKINAYNAKPDSERTQEEADQINTELEDVNARVDRENDWLITRFAAFPPAVENAFASTPDPKQITAVISAVEQAGKMYKGNQCNFYAGKVGELLDVPYFRDVVKDKSPDGRMANEIYGFIEKAVDSEASGWRQVSANEAQLLANSGKFVVGVARHKNPAPTNHGHVCVVAPSGKGHMAHATHRGSGPWVRDSQNPDLSVKASKRFGSSVVEPIWSVWEGGK